MVDVYTRLVDLHYKHRVVPLPGEAAQPFGTANLFNTGKAVMTVVSVGGRPTYVNNSPQVSMTAVPVPKVKITTPDVNSHALAIIKGSEAHAGFLEAIKYWWTSRRPRAST